MSISYPINDQFLVESALPFKPVGLTNLEDAFNIVQSHLYNFASLTDYQQKLALAFGDNFDTLAVNTLSQAWQNSDFSIIPTIEILADSDLNGANGAFSTQTNRIYLSEFLINNASLNLIVNVILEEIGHKIDSVVNTIDSLGDEGAIFSLLVRGAELTDGVLAQLQAENDHGTIVLNGQEVEIEKAASAWKNAVSGNWSASSNWNPAPPNASDEAVIALDGTYTVTLDVDSTILGLTMGGATGTQTLAINGRTLTLNGTGTVNNRGVINLSAGYLTGNETLTTAGIFNWSGGEQFGTGKTIVTGALNITTNGDKVLNGRTLETRGNTLWNGTYRIRGYNGAT